MVLHAIDGRWNNASVMIEHFARSIDQGSNRHASLVAYDGNVGRIVMQSARNHTSLSLILGPSYQAQLVVLQTKDIW